MYEAIDKIVIKPKQKHQTRRKSKNIDYKLKISNGSQNQSGDEVLVVDLQGTFKPTTSINKFHIHKGQ